MLEAASRLREVGRVDRSRLAVAAAVPSAIGYAIPLIAGLAAGQVADGVTAATGALIVGFANLGGRYRLRSATLLATAAAAAIGTLVGGLTSHSIAVTTLLVAAWSCASGLLVALGPRFAFIGLLSTWALLLGGDLNLHGTAVLHETWLIAAGGLVQTGVAIVLWPVRPFSAERRAVADAYATLAAYARMPDTVMLPRAAAALASAAATTGATVAPVGERGVLRTLVEQGEWIRLELAAVSHSGAPGTSAALAAAATALDAIATRTDPGAALRELRGSVDAIDEPAARHRAESLVGWITATVRESSTGAPDASAYLGPRPFQTLRAELTPRSRVLRHALRLAFALSVAVVLYRGLSLGFGYWVPLTVLFVLKPEYGSTVTRGLGRALGTTAGVTIGWAVVTQLSLSGGEIVALLALLACSVYTLFPANYALSSVALTVLVTLVVDFSGGSPIGALQDRILDTAIGAAIAIGAMILWPTREAATTIERLRSYVAAEGDWLAAIMAAYADGDDRASMRATRLAARRARREAHEAVERVVAEPGRRRLDERRLRALLAVMDRISESALALVAVAHDGARVPRERLAPYRSALGNGFYDVESALADADTTPARIQAPGNGGDDPVLSLIAAETAKIVAALAQVERLGQEVRAAPPA